MMHKNNTSFSKIKVCTLKMKHGYAPRRPEAKSGKEVKLNTKLNLDYSIFIATKFNSFARRARSVLCIKWRNFGLSWFILTNPSCKRWCFLQNRVRPQRNLLCAHWLYSRVRPHCDLVPFDMLRQLYMTPCKQMKNVYLYKSWQMVLRLSCIYR